MSADNWAICPRCAKNEVEKSFQFSEKVRNSYGKVPRNEYLEMVEQDIGPVFNDFDLREDYGIGMDEEGFFEIYYSCQCSKCGFSYDFKHKQQLEI